MRITPRLIQIASLMIAAGYGVACGSSSNGSSFPGGDGGTGDGGGGDAGGDAQVACGGCGCNDEDAGPASVTITAAQACDLLASYPGDSGIVNGTACQTYCGASTASCDVAATFVADYAALNSDAGALDGSVVGDGGNAQCPTETDGVVLSCTRFGCLGRLTEGFTTPKSTTRLGDRFAAMAFLEAVSVHAFDRLERELRAHGAGADLLRDARRAKRDEQRHTVTMAGLARRHGCEAKMPDAPQSAPVRSLFEIALENAVEGCVRETYGAVVGLIEGETSTSKSVRRAMRSVSTDECRHAELAWAVHAWAMPQLSADEARRVEIAMRAAIGEIAERDAKIAALLFDDESARIVA
jgi:hypothetical protein